MCNRACNARTRNSDRTIGRRRRVGIIFGERSSSIGAGGDKGGALITDTGIQIYVTIMPQAELTMAVSKVEKLTSVTRASEWQVDKMDEYI